MILLTRTEHADLMRRVERRVLAIERKRGPRLRGRLRLARVRLWQAFVGIE